MARVSIRSAAAAFLALGMTLATDAEALRCGTRLISPGDHQAKLLEFCGEPVTVESRHGRGLYRGNRDRPFIPGLFQDVLVENWTYNFGPRRLMRRVRIEDGFVVEIKQLGYGFRPRY
jgi:hypothetical protein